MKLNLRTQLLKYTFLSLDACVIVFAFILENAQAFFRTRQFPDVTLFDGYGWGFLPNTVWIYLFIGVLVYRYRLGSTLHEAWKRNWLLIAFLGYAALSLLWSVYFPAGLYKLTLLFFSTVVGSYLAVRFASRGVIEVLTWIAIPATLFSLFLVWFTTLGTMWNVPFVGSWNGMFWHRNHAGSLFAYFNALFLLRFWFSGKPSITWKLVFGTMYVLTAIHVFGSRSAAGVIVFLVLNASIFAGIGWMKWHSRLKRRHYLLIAAAAVAGVAVFLFNVSFFFGLLGRTAHMTGRIPLWRDLFLNVYLQKPLLGYGYGSLWMQESFRVLMQTRHGWTYPVYFADNGFFDILLNTGLLGFVLFIGVYIQAWVRGVKEFIASKDWVGLFLVITLLYIFVGNLAYSFLLEVDQFVWMILVVMVFVLTPAVSHAPATRNSSERVDIPKAVLPG